MKGVLAVVLLAVGLTVSASAQGSSAFRIAYYGSVHGLWQVFTVSSAGGQPHRLTSGTLNSADPALSRGGARIAYDKGSDGDGTSDIWTMNADGTNKRRLTSTSHIAEYNPSWCPDGSKIAFDAGKGVWVMNRDGSGRHRLTSTTFSYGAPSWSPDGTKLVYSSYPQFSSTGQLYIVSVATGRVHSLVKGFAPAWSPNGKTIVFSRKTSVTASDLWLVNADGTNLRRLTNTSTRFEVFSSWSPDGSQIAVWAEGDGTQPDEMALYLMNKDGSNSHPLGVTTTSRWWGGLGS
jgi:Tol biopolymer transport system component